MVWTHYMPDCLMFILDAWRFRVGFSVFYDAQTVSPDDAGRLEFTKRSILNGVCLIYF